MHFALSIGRAARERPTDDLRARVVVWCRSDPAHRPPASVAKLRRRRGGTRRHGSMAPAQARAAPPRPRARPRRLGRLRGAPAVGGGDDAGRSPREMAEILPLPQPAGPLRPARRGGAARRRAASGGRSANEGRPSRRPRDRRRPPRGAVARRCAAKSTRRSAPAPPYFRRRSSRRARRRRGRARRRPRAQGAAAVRPRRSTTSALAPRAARSRRGPGRAGRPSRSCSPSASSPRRLAATWPRAAATTSRGVADGCPQAASSVASVGASAGGRSTRRPCVARRASRPATISASPATCRARRRRRRATASSAASAFDPAVGRFRAGSDGARPLISRPSRPRPR